MTKLIAISVLTAASIVINAQEVPDVEIATDNLPSIEDCIPKPVANLKEPSLFPFEKGLVTAVSAATEMAQIHTVQGLNHLHGGWELEATRHFAVAMKSDPNCLMAHWGMVMSMLAPHPETDSNRLAATERLLQLITDGEGTELERGFAYALVKYIEEGPQSAEAAFEKVSNKFPADVQSQIFAALFGRSGYDELGNATPNQKTAEEELMKLVERYPNNTVPLHALLLIRAEAPDLKPSLELARKLCQLGPDYAPYFQLLGHYEWRCGEHTRAASAFANAARIFSIWMNENETTPKDCPEWVRAECYRVVALASKGDFENALASAEKISTVKLDSERPNASGTRQLLWEARTLPARVLMRRDLEGDSAKAIESLPAPDKDAIFRKNSLSYWWVDTLRIASEARRLLEAGDVEKATDVVNALSFHGEAMEKMQKEASSIGEYSEWRRSFLAAEILAAELKGRLALVGPPEGQGSAFNWFRAAADRQHPASMLTPPPILVPMAARVGDYHIKTGNHIKAIEAYKEALAKFPNDQTTLVRLKSAEALPAAGEENEDSQ